MSSKDAALYSMPGAKKKTSSSHEISSSTTLAFTSQLTSLISGGDTARAASGRSRPKKDDIFSAHNRNFAKRAKKDLDDAENASFDQKHSTRSEALDADAWHRSRRKMEEKARLYAAMKRGDVDDEDGKHMVDFDRKWAQKRDENQGEANGDTSSEDDQLSESEMEMVEWVDEFGRSRSGTKAERTRWQRAQELGREIETRARPAVPSNIIYGDTVQADAFKPEEDKAAQMAKLAAKRDRSLTPPPDVHFDASKEIRSKGVGFMQFSNDEEERKRQMEALEKDRLETEARREERQRKLKERREEVEERRRKVNDARGKRKADDFLRELGNEMEQKASDQG